MSDRREDLRQLEHLIPVGFAFLLPYLPYWAILSLAGLAILHALAFSPFLVKATTRDEEAKRRFSPGKLYYALGVLALILIFRERLYIAAAVWALLSVGDSFSNWLGRRIGRRKLPWHPQKSWEGIAAFWLPGGLAAALLLWWNLPPGEAMAPSRILACALAAALLAALGESLPDVVDDNISIVWIGAVSLPLLLQIPSPAPHPAAPALEAGAVSVGAAILARLLDWVSTRGAGAGAAVAFLVYLGLGLPGFLVLLAFVALGSVATKLGYAHKKRLRIAEGAKGERGISNVLANGSVALAAALLALWLDAPPILRVAFTASLAAAALDTVATEIGQWLGRRTINPLAWKPVPPGTPGAVSLEGTLAGWLAALAVCSVPPLLGWLPPAALACCWTAAAIAGAFESAAGILYSGGLAHSDEARNLYSTLVGATAAAVLWPWF